MGDLHHWGEPDLLTVYLRYHYVIDLVAGVMVGLFTLYSWSWVRERMLWLRTRFIS